MLLTILGLLVFIFWSADLDVTIGNYTIVKDSWEITFTIYN